MDDEGLLYPKKPIFYMVFILVLLMRPRFEMSGNRSKTDREPSFGQVSVPICTKPSNSHRIEVENRSNSQFNKNWLGSVFFRKKPDDFGPFSINN